MRKRWREVGSPAEPLLALRRLRKINALRAASVGVGDGAVERRRRLHCTEIALAVGVASNTSVDGQIGHVVPSAAGAFGSPR